MTVSQQNLPASQPTRPAVQKQPLNVYTIMLVIAFLALLLANILLWAELRRWGTGVRWWDTTGSQPSLQQSYLLPQQPPVRHYVANFRLNGQDHVV